MNYKMMSGPELGRLVESGDLSAAQELARRANLPPGTPLPSMRKLQSSLEFDRIFSEILRWRTLPVAAVLVAIYRYTPLWHKANQGVNIWTIVTFALPLLAIGLVAPSSYRYVGGCLILLVLFPPAILAVSWLVGLSLHRKPATTPQTPSQQAVPKHSRHSGKRKVPGTLAK